MQSIRCICDVSEMSRKIDKMIENDVPTISECTATGLDVSYPNDGWKGELDMNIE